MKSNKQLLPIFLVHLFLLFSCASKEPVVVCPTVEAEPISACRAQQNCKHVTSSQSVSTGVGFGLGGATSFGVGVGHQFPSNSYTSCIDEDLAQQQKAQGKVQLPSK